MLQSDHPIPASNLATIYPGLYRCLCATSFRMPTFLRPRRSFNKLRSFYLFPTTGQMQDQSFPSPALFGGTISNNFTSPRESQSWARNNFIQTSPRRGNTPLRNNTIVTLAIMLSLFFVICISLAFIGADADEPLFKHMLNGIGQTTPGVRDSFSALYSLP